MDAEVRISIRRQTCRLIPQESETDRLVHVTRINCYAELLPGSGFGNRKW